MENIRGITTFIQIVRTGNFSSAARELGITPQSASSHVKQLEDWVGVRLFNRSTRAVSLTEEGRRFYDTCVGAVTAIDDEVARMRDTTGEVFGTVRVAAPMGMASRFVAPAIAALLDKYPRISVDLLVQNRIPDVVAEGIDVGILPHPLPDTNLIARRVVTSPFVLCAAPSYLRRHSSPGSVEELALHRRVDLRSWITQSIRPWRIRCDHEEVTCQAPPRLVTNDSDTMIEALLSGAGIGLITLYRVAPYLRSGRLQTVLDGRVVGELSFSLYMQQRHQVPRKTRIVADFLFDVLNNHPDLTGHIRSVRPPST
jgi:DNA-binding transcriptional LysR family regulator